MKVYNDTTEPMPVGNQDHRLNHNRIMKILKKENHPVEIIPPQDYPAYLKKKRMVSNHDKS